MPMIYSAVFNMEMNLKKQDSVIADKRKIPVLDLVTSYKRKIPVLALATKERYLYLLW